MSTFPMNLLTVPEPKRAAILAAAAARPDFAPSPRRTPPLARVFRALTLLLLLLTPLPNRANSGSVRIPFRTVRSLMLVEGKVDDHPVTFVFDTGSNHTIVSTRSYGRAQFLLRRAQRNRDSAGMTGDSVRLPVDLTLANHIWVGQPVSVMNLDELQAALGLRFDGLLGQDILREFRAVRIDYRAHTIELEN